jgi:hypothetical protein
MSEKKPEDRFDFIAKYTRLLRNVTDAPEEFQEAAGLFLISTVIGRNWVFKSMPDASIFGVTGVLGGRLLNVWIIILGKSRVSRKTSGVLKHIQEILDVVIGPDRSLTKSFTPEFLIKEMATKTQEISGVKITHCYWTKDEVAGFFKLVKKRESYMADIDDVLSSIYDGTSTTRGTIGREQEKVENPYLTCFLASTDFLPALFDELQLRLGFLNRFIFVIGKRKDRKELRTNELSEAEKHTAQEIKDFLRELAAKKTLTIMEITEEAKHVYDSFEKQIENKIETENLDIKEGYCGQLPNIVVRLSCLYRLSRMSLEEIKSHNSPILAVEKQDVERAIAYAMKAWEWFEEIIKIMKSGEKAQLLLPISSAKNAALECLADGSEKHVSVISDYAAIHVNARTATLYNALKALLSEGKIEKTRHGYYKLKLTIKEEP